MKKLFGLILIATIFFSTSYVNAQIGGSSPASTINPINPSSSSTVQQLNQTQLNNQRTACLAQGYYWLSNNTCSIRSEQSSQVLQRFQPGVSIQSGANGSKIGGVSFSGLGSSILACSGAGKEINNAITRLGDKLADSNSGFLKGLGKALGIGTGGSSALGGGEVPTNSNSANTELKSANKKESCLDAVAYTLAKQALSQVTNKTLNWVNTGFGGNPFYVRDIDSFLKSIEKEKYSDYINIVSNSDNQLISGGVTNKLIELFTGKKSPTLSYTPRTSEEIKYDAFSKDFTNGGWSQWLNITTGSQNPLGQFLNVTENLSRSFGEQQDQASKELTQGNGFLSQKKCVEYAQAPSPDDDYDFNLNSDGSLKCLKYETVTPGSVIASQTQNITNSGTRQLEAADELNEVLGSFFDSLLNKLFNKGLQTLGRNSGDNFGNDFSQFGGQGSNIVIGSNGQPINGTGSGVILPFDQGGDDYDTSSFNISNPRHIASIIKAQKTFLNKALDSQASLQKIIPNLGRLDYCLPGPTPSWQTGVATNSQILFGTMRASGMANSVTGFFNIQPYDFIDTLKNNTFSFSNKTLVIQNDPFVSGADIANIFSGWLQSFQNSISSSFSSLSLASSFSSLETTASGQQFARGFVSDAINETSLIPQYLQSVVETDNQYESALNQTRSTITELESIRAEVLDIVTTARTRHIANKRAQGITVNMTCLNEAYDISNAPISGSPRQESDATTLLNDLEAAQNSFYNNL
ncbi:hypothetical protein IT402_02510 [Candidatus Nomurabacteria bacterium]|nr:hypothetical protein [Candidatus Nomurabacteria bacterium]